MKFLNLLMDTYTKARSCVQIRITSFRCGCTVDGGDALAVDETPISDVMLASDKVVYVHI